MENALKIFSVIMVIIVVAAAISMLPEQVDNFVGQESDVCEASYIIYKDGDDVCAKNGTSGRVDWRDSNSSLVIQNAVDATFDSGGGNIRLVPSRSSDNLTIRSAFNTTYDWNFTNTIYIWDGVSIDGQGSIVNCFYRNDTIFELRNPEFETYALDDFNMALESFTFVGNESNLGTNAIFVSGWSRGIVISDIYTDSIANPIHLLGSVYNAEISQCRLIHGQTGIRLEQNVTSGQWPNAVKITGCDISGFDLVGINCERSTGLKVSENYLEANQLAMSLNYTDPVINDNYFYVDVGQTGVRIDKKCNPTIDGNAWIIKSTGIGINNTEFWAHMVVTSNEFTQYAGSQTIVSYQETIGTIGNNHCYITGTTLGSSFFWGKLVRSSLTGNTIYGGNPAINMTDGAWTAFTGNSINNAVVSMCINSVDRSTIDGNVMRGTLFDLNITASNYNVITGNNFYAAVKVNLISGSNLIKDNFGYVTENYGTATILSGATTVTVTHGLSITPTRVFVTGLTSETAACWVTAINATAFVINVAGAVSGNSQVYWEAYGYDPTP